MDEVSNQRNFFSKVAMDYDSIHSKSDEHGFALAWLAGLFQFYGFESYCEIGAGTGRHLLELQSLFPHAQFIGIESVEAMRQQGYAKGISRNVLIDGDGYHLPFPDGAFD